VRYLKQIAASIGSVRSNHRCLRPPHRGQLSHTPTLLTLRATTRAREPGPRSPPCPCPLVLTLRRLPRQCAQAPAGATAVVSSDIPLGSATATSPKRMYSQRNAIPPTARGGSESKQTRRPGRSTRPHDPPLLHAVERPTTTTIRARISNGRDAEDESRPLPFAVTYYGKGLLISVVSPCDCYGTLLGHLS
jgi:hypothetical protein